MKRLLLLSTCLLLPLFGLTAEDQAEPISTTTTRQLITREVNIKIEPLSEEQLQAGLTVDMIQETIAKQLQDADIEMNESIAQPTLLLRIRTITVGFDMATFFQLSLLEEAMLIRNRSMFNAATWSQVSLLSCRPEDLKKEVLETVSVMAQSFSKDYVKAMQPSTK